MRSLLLLLLTLLSISARAEECTLPPGFVDGFIPSFRTSFERGFSQSLANTILYKSGVPDGWDASGYQQFAADWWGRELRADSQEVGADLSNEVLEMIRTGPLCPKMAVFATAQPDPVQTQAVMTELQAQMVPLIASAQQRMRQRLPPERLQPMTARFHVQAEAAKPKPAE